MLALSGRLFVSGYWPVQGNQKRSLDHYTTLLPQTLKLIRGEHLVFYSSSDQVLDLVEALCRDYKIALQPEMRSIRSLPAWDLSARLTHCCGAMNLDQWERPSSFGGEKAVIHYWRDYKEAGPEVFRRVLAVWLSKINLLAALSSGVDHCRLVWMDATLARFNHRRSNWRFWLSAEHPQKFCHYGSPMRCFGRYLPLNASYLSGPRSRWGDLQGLFVAMAERAACMPYAHDEETILAQCLRRHPDWFHCIGVPYGRLEGRRLLQARLKNSLLIGYPPARR